MLLTVTATSSILSPGKNRYGSEMSRSFYAKFRTLSMWLSRLLFRVTLHGPGPRRNFLRFIAAGSLSLQCMPDALKSVLYKGCVMQSCLTLFQQLFFQFNLPVFCPVHSILRNDDWLAWRIRWKTTFLCCVVYDSCAKWYAHAWHRWAVLKDECSFRFRTLSFCVFV